ncbi:hypothetical protein [Acanthopleuribacter pedis]|uniref:Uncharacterized protein n=1 Tax=Acanthopleuribacter pedis TaxID=442870 RepID=A0A8J7U655_9BACT|nr:hypothetical protein [Acanthopleuribacter pedis]
MATFLTISAATKSEAPPSLPSTSTVNKTAEEGGSSFAPPPQLSDNTATTQTAIVNIQFFLHIGLTSFIEQRFNMTDLD